MILLLSANTWRQKFTQKGYGIINVNKMVGMQDFASLTMNKKIGCLG